MIVWALNELSREREPSRLDGKRVIVNRITYRAIREWIEFRRFDDDPDLMDELFTLIRAMDSVWVEVETKLIQGKIGKANGRTP